jgi:septal ring factor EnvC (AmiA/AmiB activator)
METMGTVAGTQGAMGAVEAQLAAARATIEQHEAQARVHAEERAAHYAEMARVTGERDEAREQLCAWLDVTAESTERLEAQLSTATGEIARLRAALVEVSK